MKNGGEHTATIAKRTRDTRRKVARIILTGTSVVPNVTIKDTLKSTAEQASKPLIAVCKKRKHTKIGKRTVEERMVVKTTKEEKGKERKEKMIRERKTGAKADLTQQEAVRHQRTQSEKIQAKTSATTKTDR